MANFSKGTGYSKSDLKGTGSPIILYGRLYTKYETIIRNVDSFVVPKSGSVFSKGGELIVPGSGETAEDISIASVVEPAGILLGGDLNIIYPNSDLDPTFLAITISNGKPHFDMARRAQGKSIVHLHNADLKHISLKTPNLSEQKRISKFFEVLDQIITLHEEKKHQLEQLKSALLQKMFADKSGYPAVRFKKYNSTWVLRRIIDLLNQAITDGPHETPCLVSKGIPFISADAIVNNKIDFSRKRGNITKKYDLECCKKYQPQMHDIYLVKSGSTVGKVAIVETTTRFNIWSPLAALRCGEKSDPYFVFFLMQTEKFQTQVKNKASNGTQPNLSMRALEGFKVIVSIELNEQQAIGNLFKKMNELIDLHQHKIDNLIAVKQWLLQNMFI